MSSFGARAVSWRVLFQMATVGVSTGIVKIAAAAKVIATARAFGTSDGVDAYLIAFLLPTFVSDTLAGALTSSLVPTFIEVRHREGNEAANRLYRSVMAAGFALLACAAIVVGAFAPWIFRVLASSFPESKIALTCSLFWLMLPLVPISALATCWRSILNTEGRFALPAILPALTPVLSITFLFAFGRTWGVFALAVGTLAGGILEAALLAWAMSRRAFPVLPRWFGRNAALDQVMAQYAPVIASVMLLGPTPLIDQSIAAMLGSGSVAALNYGTRVAAVLIAMGPGAVATAILPHFSRLTVTEDWNHVRHSLRGYAAIIVAIALPAVAVLMLFSAPIVRLIFEHGEFSRDAAALVTRIQRFSLLQIPAALVMALVLRFISSLKANRILVRVAAMYAVVNIGLAIALARTIGAAGIPLATAIVQFAALLYLLRLMRTHLPASLSGVPSRAAASS